jgi:CheY-like chemotaxis protein
MPDRRADRTQDSVERLGGAIAHELNGALTVIIGGLQGLTENVRSWTDAPPEFKQALDYAKRGADRVVDLALRLQSAAGERELDPGPVCLGEFLTNVSGKIRTCIGESTDMEMSAAEDLWNIEVDTEQLLLAIDNLATNAREAMPSGGKLWIEAANITVRRNGSARAGLHPGDYVVITFRDTGEGMTPEVRERATEICFTVNRSGRNLGLGLSQAARFAALSGGDLKLESEPGIGTKVELYFPRVVPKPAAELSEPRIAKSHSGSILLVDDDDDVREYIVEALQELNYTVAVARNAEEAVAQLEKVPSSFDLLLTDMLLPGSHGHELAREALKRCPTIGVLFMSGQGRDAFPAAALPAHAELIAKPMTKAALDERIRRVLRRLPAGA